MSEVIKSGAEILVDFLISRGVKIIFCITGAGNLAIVDALVRDGTIEIVYSHHEQAAVMEAQGYSRISGQIGVALVTTGGGTSNVVTGVLSAYLDSIPVLIISGNESSFHCENPVGLRAYGVQGFDSVAVLSPVTKFSQRINEVADTRNVLQSAVDLALQNRMGPVHIDFPMDLQRKTTPIGKLVAVSNLNHGQKGSHQKVQDFVAELYVSLSKSERPALYIGNGCRDNSTLTSVQEVINQFQIPYFVSWSAIDLFPDSDPLNFGRVGIYGDRAANILLQKSDLLLTLGTRLAIPQVGYDRIDFARKASKWIVEIDPSECEKFDGLGWNVLNANVKDFTSEFNAQSMIKQQIDNRFVDWVSEGSSIWRELPRLKQVGPVGGENGGYLHSAEVVAALNKLAADDAVIATDVGAGLLTGHNIYEQSKNRRFFTSQGLGEMGFGLPGAIGAYFVDPASQIICLNTDGAIMFNMQELQLVKEHKIPLKLFIFNNSGYAMIKISQNNLFGARIAGSSISSGISFPEFGKLAELFGMQHIPLKNTPGWEAQLEEGLNNDSAVLIEVIMNPEQKYLPRLATSKLADGTLVSPPIEDLDPLLELEVLERYLGYAAHPNSSRARGLQ